MRRHRFRVLARRHLLDEDVRQLEIEPPRFDGGDLRQRRVLNDRKRSIRRLAPVALDNRPDARFVEGEHRRQQPDRAVQILRVLADDRNAVGAAVVHEDLAGAVDDQPARRPQRERPLVVVLGHLLELRVLDDLQRPEADGEYGEDHRDHVLQNRQP